MKKEKLKRTVSLMLSASLVVGTVTVCKNDKNVKVNAAETFHFVSPKANALKAAGYILMDWTDVEGANNYYLYVDGKQVARSDKSEVEYYSTEVKMHTAYVIATRNNGADITSETVSFGVSKKGLAVNDEMGRYLDPAAMGTSWYYNWATSAFTHSTYDQLDYVPMIWGIGNDGMISTIANRGDRYLLAYNEPDMTGDAGGSNTDVQTVLNHWPNFLGNNYHLGGPAPAFSPSWDNGTWARNFYGTINLDDIDFIPLHCYYGRYGGAGAADTFVNDVVKKTYELYHKPIWITEFAPSGFGNNDAQGKKECYDFLEAVSKKLDELSYVERYSWFSFNTTDSYNGAAALWTNSTGELTELGKLYCRVGLPEGYSYNAPDEESKNYTTKISTRNKLLDDSVSENGRIYMDFTKSPGVSAKASSVSGNNIASNAIDEDISSRWESQQNKDPQSITIDLGQNRYIKQIDVVWEAAQARDYTIEVSVNGNDFDEVAKLDRLVSVNYRHDSITLNEMAYGRYVRINGTARNLTYGYSIFDMAVYGGDYEEKVDLQVLGFQYSINFNGFRVLYSVDNKINGKAVVELGNIFAYDKNNNLNNSELIINSNKRNVKKYVASSKGKSNKKYSTSSTATDYVMTIIGNGSTKEELSRRYIIRTYAVLSDGSVVYGEPKRFSIYEIAQYLYDNKLMSTKQEHDFLYNTILTVVKSNYRKINF